ncbi:hypothetical protein FRB94_013863 [Tulasnella sp. JGI-2019a]|nr:hypothetical protein FRB94_013863 [Tulasnella sp. JGI-2019a]
MDMRPEQQPRVGIFWDYENCSPPANVPGYIVAEQIRKAAHAFGPVTVFKAYLALSAVGITKEIINLRSELQSSGVSLTDCPRMDHKKGVVDKMLLVDMLAFALDNPAPAVVMLISGDREFVYAISILRHRRYTVVVVIPPEGSYITLTSQANVVLDWKYDIFAQNEDTSDASPHMPARRVSFTSANGSVRADAPWSDKPTASNINHSRSFSTTLDIPLEEEADVTADNQIPYNPPSSDAGVPLDASSRIDLPSSTGKSFADAALNVPELTVEKDAEAKRADIFSVVQNDGISSHPRFSIKTLFPSPNEANQPTSKEQVCADGSSYESPSEGDSEMTSGTDEGTTGVLPTRNAVDALASENVVSFKSPPFSPTERPLASSLLPGSDVHPTSSLSAINSAGQSEKDDASTSANDPSREFSNLIEILERLRLMGKQKPRWSAVAGELYNKNPLLYQRVGVRGFKQYVALAEQAKVVVTDVSEGSGKEWITLADAYKGRVFPMYTEIP